MARIRNSYERSSACVTVAVNVIYCSRLCNGVGMSPWLFDIYMDGVTGQAYGKTQGQEPRCLVGSERVGSYSTNFRRRYGAVVRVR